MIIGIPKEVKPNEYRVACGPNVVREIISHGHRVLIEKDAGLGSGFTDEDYREQGGEILDSSKEIFAKADLIYKVKEVFPEEFELMREDQIIFTYIHSNAFRSQTDAMIEKKIIGIAYEDVTDKEGGYPLLKPMSILAGKGGFLAALHFMQKTNGGMGLLLSRTEGIRSPEITIIGAGSAGLAAADLASSFGNKVTIINRTIERMEEAKKNFPQNVEFLYSNRNNLEMCLKRSDVVINCVMWPKIRKDHLISRDMLKIMKKGSLIVDVSCDEAGAIETSLATSHDNPIYEVEGINHYCVDNIPSAFSRTATQLLGSATLPYLLEIADKGVEKALKENEYLRRGLSFYKGQLTLEETGLKQDRKYTSPEEVLALTNN